MASVAANIPDAPKHMSAKAQKQWQATYVKALEQAEIDYPNDASAQRRAAYKAANVLLAVPAPKSAKDIDALDDWQVLVREERTIDNVPHKICVTTDGRKYAHPVDAKKTPAAAKETPAA